MRVNPLLKTILYNTCVGVTCAAPLSQTVLETVGGIWIIHKHVHCYLLGQKCEDNHAVKYLADKANRFVPKLLQKPMIDKVLYWSVLCIYTASMGAISLCLGKHSISRFSNVCGSINQFRSIPKAT
jgi:hypothetical protein